ncbi:MAG: tandem-95 repeat protein, partial [Planctomycetota bacterium]
VSASGLFAAYADLRYNSSVIEPVGTNPITGIAPYENGVKGDITTAGVIDELGAFTTSTQASDGSVQGLVEVAFRAIAIGNAGLELNPADDSPQNDTLTFDSTPLVPLDRIEFGSSAFSVGADFTPADDVFNFDEDAAQQTLAVQSNDDVGNSTLNIVELSTPTGGGTVSISSDSQSVLYTPAANFNGAEIFTYTVENQAGIQGEATVTVQITAVNDPPVAIGDSFNVSENSSLNIFDVLANDNSGVDSNQETLTVSAVGTGSAGGTILIGSSGSNISYTPRPDFRGTETFTYTISDGNGGTATATVNANVEVANPPPIAINDSFTVEEDAFAATFDLLSNDTTDDPTETLSISAVGTSQNGSVFQISGGGTNVTYQPAQNFSGLEILTYTVRDSGGAEATGLVTFTVNPVNDAPVAVADTSTVISSQASTNIAVLANDSDPDADDTLTITSVTQPSSGTVAIASDNRSVDFSPLSSDFEGTVTFDYTVSDGTLSSTATVTVTVANFVPRAVSGSVGNVGSQRYLGLRLNLTGTDDLGESINRSAVVSNTGSFSFDSLAPGQYQLQRDPLPFLNDAGQTIDINSAPTDGDAVQNLQVDAPLRPQFFDIRDFLGSTIVDVLTVAVADDGTPAWVSARGAWSELTTLDVNLTDDTLSVTGVDAGSNNLQGSLNLADASTRAYEAGRESNFRLLRIPGTPTDAGVAATGGASGEGEAPAALESTIQPEAQADTTSTEAARRLRRPLASS